MSKLRLLFIKEAQASYISHLDLLRTFQRAFPRTELDIKHSQGYHPHPIISIVLPLPVGQRALLFGAGHISQALCPLLTTIGFRPVVFDDRPELANTRLFPTAEQVICGDFTRISDYLTITDEDFVVIMTSGHVRDFQVEEQTLRGDFAYVGVIGSRRKTASVNQRLLEAGIPQSSIDLVHTPIGTPILAVTPEEIAVSIAGEMIQVRAQRRGPTSHGCPMHS